MKNPAAGVFATALQPKPYSGFFRINLVIGRNLSEHCKLVLRSKSSLLVLAFRRNTLSNWATVYINQVFIYAELH
jgi:hypothetical protein